MTHRDRAEQIISNWAREFSATCQSSADGWPALISRIASGMAEASNAELERRRAVETERDNLQAITGDWKRLVAKDQTNRRRTWPPPGPEDQPIEHIREAA